MSGIVLERIFRFNYKCFYSCRDNVNSFLLASPSSFVYEENIPFADSLIRDWKVENIPMFRRNASETFCYIGLTQVSVSAEFFSYEMREMMPVNSS